MKTYPIGLIRLEGRRAIVVGGGKVAERKAAGLLEAGAQVTVISPTLSRQLQAWAQAGALTALQRDYRLGDLAGASLVIAATDDPAVNQAVCDEGQAAGCLVNSAEGPERSDFILPAVIRRGDITVAIGTGGASPALARHMRQRLEQLIGMEYAAAAALLGELRPILVERFPGNAARSAVVEALLASGLLDTLAQSGVAAARDHALSLIGVLAGAEGQGRDGRDQPAISQNGEGTL